MIELIGQVLKAFNGFFNIFNLYQGKDFKEKKNQRDEQKYQDDLENALKKGKTDEIDQKLS